MYELKLRDLRRAKGLSQEEFGNAVHISRAMISNYERCFTELPLSVAYDFADFFGCSIDELAGRKQRQTTARPSIGLDTFLSVLDADGVAMVEEYARVLVASGLYSKKQRFEGLA